MFLITPNMSIVLTFGGLWIDRIMISFNQYSQHIKVCGPNFLPFEVKTFSENKQEAFVVHKRS